MKNLSRVLLVCTAFASVIPLHAEDAAPSAAAPAAAPAKPEVSVFVGSPAPALGMSEFAQGEAIKSFDSDHVYLMEFWATWCGPCIASIPHVNELQLKYADKGFVVIGQNVWERTKTMEETHGKVDPFLKKMEGKMTYRVALDDISEGPNNGKMAMSWMAAAGKNGIPCSFLVGKDQKIAWIGHPMSLKEETIEAVLAGTYDVAGAAKSYREETANQLKSGALLQSIRAHIKNKEWDAAGTDIDEITPLVTQSPFQADLLRLELTTQKGDLPAATAVTRKIAKNNADNAALVAHVCSLLAGAAKDDKTTLEAADKILTETAAGAKVKNFQVLMGQAKVKKALGKDAEAVALAKEAVEATPEKSQPAVKGMLKDILGKDGE